MKKGKKNEEELSFENELKKLKLKAEFGADVIIAMISQQLYVYFFYIKLSIL